MRPTLPVRLALCAAAAMCMTALPVGAGEDAAGKSTPGAPPGPSLDWLEYGDALDRARSENKHVIIDFYTNWCGWCKVMDRKTYGDSSVASYLRQHFVLTKVNAESPKRLRVGGGTKSGIELARDFGVNSFPITWFLKPDGSRIDKLPGYRPPQEFQKVLSFVHERGYEKK
jgi:thioredoxin-related protein